jgi:ABC-2 type transport system permease protein
MNVAGLQNREYTAARVSALPQPGILLPSATLWWREIVRFYRNRGRVAGVILSPLLFWVVIGSGFGTSFRSGAAGGGANYLEYFFPGALTMIVLFTSIFAMMSVIEDRKEGFLLSVLVAPVQRSVIVLGKVLGGATLAALQGAFFLVFTPLLHGAHLGAGNVLPVLLTIFLVAFALTALGFAIAWPMESSQAFHAIVNLFLIPLWLLSGALFPLSEASGWMQWLMRADPLTYGSEALRQLLFPGSRSLLPVATSLVVLGLFSALMFCGGWVLATRRRTG